MNTYSPKVILRQVPILIVPNVFDKSICRSIIDLWKSNNEASYTMKEQEDGSLQRVYDASMKARRDHFVEDEKLLSIFKQKLADIVCPLMYEAFRFEATRFEDPRVGCYDAETGGYFRPHRDDSVQGTAHRLFGISINLNAGEYYGGYLLFPEYSPDFYHVETGGAIVFSGGMLHEVTPVTQGQRFALISFLYGEKESCQRKEYYRKVLLGES